MQPISSMVVDASFPLLPGIQFEAFISKGFDKQVELFLDSNYDLQNMDNSK